MSNHSSLINPTEESCLNLANSLIRNYLASPNVNSVGEINCDLIILLCEAITGCHVPDLLICQDKVEEAHNVQAVIDMLSLDVLGISLSHITGEAVVAGNLTAIYNLLQVLEGIMSCVSKENDPPKVLKRKIHRIKERKSSVKQNSTCNDSTKFYPYTIPSIPSSQSYTKIAPGISPKSKRIKPAFTKTRIKIKNIKINEKISNSSMKESSVSLPTSGMESIPEFNQSSKKLSPVDKIFEVDDGDSTVKKSHIVSKESFPTTSFPKQKVDSQCKPTIASKTSDKQKPSKLPDSSSKIKNEQEIEKLYQENMESKVKTYIEKNSSLNVKYLQMRKRYLQSMKKPVKKSFSPCHKSFLLPTSLRNSYRRKISPKRLSSRNQVILKSKAGISSEPSQNFIQDLLDEFPGIQLSPSVLKYVKEKYEQHLFKLHNQVKTCLFKKPKAEIQGEEAAKRQHLISNIIKKDIQEQQYLKDVKKRKHIENEMKYRLRDSRTKTIQMKQYCNEFLDEMRKKMQTQNNAEELIFEKVFKEVITIQKDHVEQLCNDLKEAGEEDAKKYLDYLMSLENLYQSQFALLSEKLCNEKTDAYERIKAEKQAMDKLQRDFQQKLKQEIRCMQKTTVELLQDCHFRELDAELYLERMRDKYS